MASGNFKDIIFYIIEYTTPWLVLISTDKRSVAIPFVSLPIKLLLPNVFMKLGTCDTSIRSICTGIIIHGMGDYSKKIIATNIVPEDADFRCIAFASVGLHLCKDASVFVFRILCLMDNL